METTNWISYYELLEMIYHNEILLEGLQIEDNNGKKWFWDKEQESFVMSIQEYNHTPPYLYLTDTYDTISLMELKVRVLPRKCKYNSDTEQGMSAYELTMKVLNTPLKPDEEFKVVDNLGSVWTWDNEDMCFYGNGDFEKDRMQDVYSELELASARFEMLNEENSKQDKNMEKNISNTINEIKKQLECIASTIENLEYMFNKYKNLK